MNVTHSVHVEMRFDGTAPSATCASPMASRTRSPAGSDWSAPSTIWSLGTVSPNPLEMPHE